MKDSAQSWKTRLTLAGFLLMVPSLCSAQGASQTADRHLEGIVLDQQALPIPGAEIVVTAQQGSLRKTVVTSTNRFRVDGLVPAVYEVRVEAPGFAPKVETVDLRTLAEATLEIRLEPARITEQVIVTPTRSEQRLGDVPASVTVLDSEEIRRSPAVVADDVLRQSPTFSLFRRTSSLSSHPTSQGVSLRGIGPSGTSRTLVLIDDVPFNDPFGGWVYWTRVPLMSLDRIELVDGSTSSLYGNYAMGGVINIVTRQPERRMVEIKAQYGSKTTPKVDFFASDRWNRLGVVVEGSVFDTDGYPVVAESERGPVDSHATVDYRNVSAKLQYTTSRVSAFMRGGYFTEDRVNAKVGEVNDTTWTVANGGMQLRMPDESSLQARVFVDAQTFHSTFLAVTNPTTTRNIVRLATDQRVPADGVGSLVQWSKSVGGSNVFSAGTDWRWVDGDSEEDAYSAAVPTVVVGVTQQAVLTTHRVSGGTQQSVGAFVQDIFTPVPKVAVTLSARVDRWRSYDGHNLETTVVTGRPTANNRPSLPEKSDTVVSPRVAAIYHLTDRVSAWGDYGLGFRAPTLNELYRSFSVGGTTTRPNDQLGPERLKGGEAGITVAPARNVVVRTTWYDNRVKDSVGNVTIGANLQQRQNLGRTRIWGIQSDVEYRHGSFWRFSGGYLYNQATVEEFATNPALVGKFLPQVPEHRGSVQAAYSNPAYFTFAAGVQFLGRQFDDDLNVRTVPPAALVEAGYDVSTDPGLPKYAVVDLMASRAIGNTLEVFFGVQNLFDQTYFVQTNPSTFGTPRLVHGGVRLRFTGR
ncbi:MAG: TonB-dependent receptor [Acidobacteria bacterium]|nr:TonB-dependent receptor [Acidobacteriota bacterium]